MRRFFNHLSTLALTLAALFAAAPLSTPANAVSLFWDSNGSLAGNGQWDTTTVDWRTTNVAGAADSAWTPNDGTVDANFGGATAYTATIASTINANSVKFAPTAAVNDIITGGTALNTNTIDMNITTTGEVINSNLTAPTVTVNDNQGASATTLLNLGGTNTFSTLVLGGPNTPTAFGGSNKVSISNANALPANSTVKFVRNFSQLDFTAGTAAGVSNTAYTATFNANLDLNASGAGTLTSGLGSGASGTVITLSGVISSTNSANLTFGLGVSGGQGKIILANNETYSGNTVMQMASNATQSGIVSLGINNALPATTKLTFGNSSGAGSGTFDMAGFNQKVAGLESLNGGTTNTGFIGGITNTTGTLSTLTISGNLTTSYGPPATSTVTGVTTSGNIGTTTITGVAALTGSNNNIALNLDSANTGTLSLVRPAGNTYTGGTTISGGTLRANNATGSATGTGAVVVNSGGTLAGTGAVSGSVTVNSGGTLSPGITVESLGVGPLTLAGASTLKYEINSSVALNVAADLVNVATGGAVSINPAALLSASDVATTPVVLALGTKFTLLSYAQSAGLTGNFSGFAEGSTVPIGVNQFAIHYADLQPGSNFDAPAGGTGFKYVTLTTVSAVPEAGAALLGALVCLAVGLAHVGKKLIRREPN